MKNKNKWIILACLVILGTFLACELPISVMLPTSEAKEPEVVVITVIATAEPAAEPTDAIPTATAEPAPVDWSGAWTVWMGSNYQQIVLDFVHKDGQITANAATGGGNSIAFYGQVASDKRSVTGNWESTDGRTGVFTFKILDSYTQFNGNMDGAQQICGARSVTNRPATCMAQ